MDYRDYFDEQPRRRRPYALIILLMFLSAVAGGIVSYAVAPSIFGSPGGSDHIQEQKNFDNSAQDNSNSITIPLEGKSPVVAVAQKVGPAVVGITNFKGRNFFMETVESSGTGFIIDGEKGYIVTNNHVVAGARRLLVSLSEDEQYSAQIVGQDSRTDLAVIKISTNKKLPQVELGDSSKLQVGEGVVAIGNPLGREFARSVTTGVVSALNREITLSTSSGGPEITLNLIQTDAAINPGNSGGPLVNMQGQVVGINSVKIAQEGVEGMGFAIPIDDAKPIIQEIINRGYVSRPFIGIYNFREITEEMSEWYNIPRGIYVGGVVPGSPAQKAGIQSGDIIIEFDGKRITTYAELDEALSKHKVGDKVKISVVRDGKRREFNLTLGEMPRN
ncbi:MAG: PDZ domain-containing protein [Clostridia bacterium]|nr:PDZ domain-containing protein [Clostridia bacterium]